MTVWIWVAVGCFALLTFERIVTAVLTLFADTVPYTTSWELAQALREYDVHVTTVLLPNGSHTTPVEDLALKEVSPTGEAIKEFVLSLQWPNRVPRLERISKISHPLHLLPIKSKL
jgi:hypothetical protein